MVTVMRQTCVCFVHVLTLETLRQKKLNPQRAELTKPSLLRFQSQHLSLLQLSHVYYYLVVAISLVKTLRGLFSPTCVFSQNL